MDNKISKLISDDQENAVEYMNRAKKQQRRNQKRYVESKMSRGYVELRAWILCDKETMLKLKEVLKDLPKPKIKEIIENYNLKQDIPVLKKNDHDQENSCNCCQNHTE